MTDIETQLRRLYQDHGLEPKEISRNDKPATGYWRITVKADGTDDRYMKPIDGWADNPIDHQIDFNAVNAVVEREIDSSRIPAGIVRLERFESEYAHLTIDDD